MSMVWYGTVVRCGTVCDIVCWYGMMVRFDTLYGKTRYVIWYVGDIVYGKNTVCDMVCWWYGVMVRRCG